MQLEADPGMEFTCAKTYNHSIGLSCCFRQWKAQSHCRFMHGYALKVNIVFGADKLDSNNWVMNFGGLKPVKAWLEEQFDHKTLVAADDPLISTFRELDVAKVIQLNVVPSIGVEAFAKMINDYVVNMLRTTHELERVWVESVTVSEHDGNSATYQRRLAHD